MTVQKGYILEVGDFVDFVEGGRPFKTLYSVSKTYSNSVRKSQWNIISDIYHEKKEVHLIEQSEIPFVQGKHNIDEMALSREKVGSPL